MTSLAEFATNNRGETGPRCAIETLAPELRAEIESAPLGQIQHSVIVRWLKEKHGLEIRRSTIGSHRRKECRCG